MRYSLFNSGFGLAAGLSLVLASAPAWAQMMDPASGNFGGLHGAPDIGGSGATPAFGAPKAPPPAGLPGAQSQPNTAALPSTPPTMLDPTQELFDAINRGDLTAARDAVTRGADVNGENELGLTPVQVSVDLGHNDITFLLLSNGAGRASGGPAGVKAASSSGSQLLTGGKGGARGAAAARSAAAARAEKPRVAHVRVTEKVPEAQRQLPRLYANDGGSPIPSAGFLGFDQTR